MVVGLYLHFLVLRSIQTLENFFLKMFAKRNGSLLVNERVDLLLLLCYVGLRVWDDFLECIERGRSSQVSTTSTGVMLCLV